jgi:hypothetical protein
MPAWVTSGATSGGAAEFLTPDEAELWTLSEEMGDAIQFHEPKRTSSQPSSPEQPGKPRPTPLRSLAAVDGQAAPGSTEAITARP